MRNDVERLLKKFGIFVGIGVIAGCTSSFYPRPADTAPTKHWAVEVDSSLVAVSADEAFVADPSGTSKTFRGVGGNVDEIGGPLPMFVPEVIGRFGLTDRLEIAAMAGPLRLAGETRFGLFAERRQDPLSIAVAFAGGYQPFFQRNGPWLRAGIDISRQTSKLLVMTNLSVTYGREAHAFVLNLPPRPEDALTTDGAGQHAQVARREIRFLPNLAIGTRVPSGYVMVGLVPWFVVRAWVWSLEARFDEDFDECEARLESPRLECWNVQRRRRRRVLRPSNPNKPSGQWSLLVDVEDTVQKRPPPSMRTVFVVH